MEDTPTSFVRHSLVGYFNNKRTFSTPSSITPKSRLIHLISMVLGIAACFGISASALAQLPSIDELTENNAASWAAAADSGEISVEDASDQIHDGSGSIRITTDSGFDTWAWVPATRNAAWDLSDISFIRFWAYAENPNLGFQNNSPWIRLGTTEQDYLELRPKFDMLNNARDNWHEFVVPVLGGENWESTRVGAPNLSNINFVEIHADTWGFGFQIWLDGFAFLSISEVSFKRETMELFETWRFTPRLNAVTELGTFELPPSSPELINWSSSEPSFASISTNGEISAKAAGTAEISVNVRKLAASIPVNVVAPVLPPRHEQIPAELTKSADGALWDIPVLIIRYLPTADGVNIDTRVASDFWALGEISLADMIGKIDVFDRRVKFILEEGSKFRGYNSMEAPPSLGYRVVDYITVYEPLPPGKFRFMDSFGNATHFTDYHGMFDRLGIENIVNGLDVREIWLWQGGVDSTFPVYDPSFHNPLVFIADWESNMSSPFTSDVSNSNRDPTDLPVYDHTYVLYGQNIRRTQAEAIHNHGHQLESILSHVNVHTEGNSKLFWQDFVGRDEQFNWQQGRVGDTHHPPNADVDYDYQNEAFVESDIEDWLPDKSGATITMNKDHWGGLVFPWPGGTDDAMPQRIESQWYIYWMQNMPGIQNLIPRASSASASSRTQFMPGMASNTKRAGDDVMSNWWTFTGAWDESNLAQIGLSVGEAEAESVEPRGSYEVTNEITGAWFDPAHDGEGFVVEYLNESVVVVYWFSYDENGNQAWMVGVGPVSGNKVTISKLTRPVGAKFGVDFDPNDVVREEWGSLTLEFGSCTGATASYSGPAGFGDGTFRLSKLTSIAGNACAGKLSATDRISQGSYTGSWFDPTHDGEGWIVEVLNETTAVVFWFTYTQTGEQAWFTGVGNINSTGIKFNDLTLVTGPKFGPQFDPADRKFKTWGELDIVFDSCDEGEFAFDSSLWTETGSYPAKRLTAPDSVSCTATRSWPANKVFLIGNPDSEVLAEQAAGDGTRLSYIGSRDSTGFPATITKLQASNDVGELLSEVTLDELGRPTSFLQFNGISTHLAWSGESAVAQWVDTDGIVLGAVEIDISGAQANVKRTLPRLTGKKYQPSTSSQESQFQKIQTHDKDVELTINLVRSNGSPITGGAAVEANLFSQLDNSKSPVWNRYILDAKATEVFTIPTETFEIVQIAKACKGFVDALQFMCLDGPDAPRVLDQAVKGLIAACGPISLVVPITAAACAAPFLVYEGLCGNIASVAASALVKTCEGIDFVSKLKYQNIIDGKYDLVIKAPINGRNYSPTVGNPTTFNGESPPSQLEFTIQTEATTVTVPSGNPRGVDTRLDVFKGLKLSFSASGTWCWGGSNCTNGNGWPGRPSSQELPVLVTGTEFATLVGQVGNGKGCYFKIGKSATVSMPCTGRLKLMMSDRVNYYGDNSGSLTVTVE